MRILRGSLWDVELDNCLRVIPVNLGWKTNGENVMGRGVAKQAAEKYPILPSWYGWRCEAMADTKLTRLYRYQNLLLFPVKPLFKTSPQLSWQRRADLTLVEESTKQLANFFVGTGTNHVALPLVGCGNGGLPPLKVLPILQRYLKGDRFLLILTNTSYKELQPWL